MCLRRDEADAAYGGEEPMDAQAEAFTLRGRSRPAEFVS
jgi:hypothetical protein